MRRVPAVPAMVVTETLPSGLRLLTEKTELLEQHNAVLRLKVDAMARKLFGRSSEKLDPAQLQMCSTP